MLSLPFFDRHAVTANRIDLIGQCGQFVIMRRKQAAAPQARHQMLDRRPRDRQPVKGRCAAPDFIEDDEGVLCALIKNGGGFDHLDHKRRPPRAPNHPTRQPGRTVDLRG